MAKSTNVLYKVQNKLCFICKKELPNPHIKWKQTNCITLDHLVPTFLGGSDRITNKVAVHWQCNKNKDSKWPTEAQIKDHREIRLALFKLGLITVDRIEESYFKYKIIPPNYIF